MARDTPLSALNGSRNCTETGVSWRSALALGSECGKWCCLEIIERRGRHRRLLVIPSRLERVAVSGARFGGGVRGDIQDAPGRAHRLAARPVNPVPGTHTHTHTRRYTAPNRALSPCLVLHSSAANLPYISFTHESPVTFTQVNYTDCRC